MLTRSVTSALSVAAFLFFAVNGVLWAGPPRMVIGGEVGGTSYGYESGGGDSYARAGGEWRLGWRDSLASGGYFGLNALVGFDYFGDPVDDVQDTEYLAGDLALPLGSNRIIVEVSAISSFNRPGDIEARVEPEWSATYRIKREGRALEPYLSYRGSHVYEDGGLNDRLTHRGVIGAEYDPSLRFGTKLELAGGYQMWPEYELAEKDGTASSEERADYLGETTLTLSGLLGYFVDWNVELGMSYRDSNANRYLEAVSELEQNSEDRLGTEGKAGIRWTPTRQVGISAETGLSTNFYTQREALDDAGTPTGDLLHVTTLDGEVSLDWTPNDTVFFLIGTGFERDYSNEESFGSWSWSGDVGVEFVL